MSKGELAGSSNGCGWLGIVAILLAHSFALFLVLMMLVKVVPMYTVFFEHQDVALPVVTRRIVWFSEFCLAYWFIMYFLGMVADAAIVLTLARAASKRRWLLSAYSHLCLLAAGAMLFYVSAWLSHPVYSLVR